MAKTRQSPGRRSPSPQAAPAENGNVNTLKSILALFQQSGLRALSYEDSEIILQLEAHSAGGDVVTRVAAPAVQYAAPAAPAAPAHPHVQATHTDAPKPGGGHIITSPFVGTFYRAPNPSSPPFAAVGANVKKGQTLCIIEAMKLMNEIEADEAGSVAEIYVENGAPVEFGQKLFRILPA